MLSPEISLEGRLNLSPQLQYALTILQFDTLSLYSHLQMQALENPIISMDHLHSCQPFAQRRDSFSNEIPDRKSELHLRQMLQEQIPWKISVEQRKILLYLIDRVDSSGYLRISPLALAHEFGTPVEKISEAIKTLQCMDPPGVGAASTEECLILQLKRQGLDDSLTRRIIQHHLPDIAAGRLGKIAREEKAALETVRKSVQKVRQLRPHPTNGYTEDEDSVFSIPEISVEIVNGAPTAMLVENAKISIQKVQPYVELLAEMKDEQARRFLRENIARYSRIEYALVLRYSTLLSIAQVIVGRQRQFFLTGDKALCPLSLEDIAQAIGFHVSTVSKALQQKYLICSRGMFPLKYFLSRYTKNTESDTGATVSQTQIAQRIAALIRTENPDAPLSDSDIFNLLQKEGIAMSRRSVVNYRERLGYPCSYQRKENYRLHRK